MIELMVRTSRVWGTRVFADGRIHEYTDREVRFVDGQFQEKTIPLTWRPLTQLTAEERQQLAQIIDEIGFFGFPAQVAQPNRQLDGATVVWQVRLHGKVHQVKRQGTSASMEPGLEQLRKLIEQLTAVALRRDNQPT